MGDVQQKVVLHHCLGIGYWHSATFMFFPSTTIHYIWLGWTRGAHLHVRNSIEGLE